MLLLTVGCPFRCSRNRGGVDPLRPTYLVAELRSNCLARTDPPTSFVHLILSSGDNLTIAKELVQYLCRVGYFYEPQKHTLNANTAFWVQC